MNAASTEKITYSTYVLLPLLQIHSLEHNFVDGIVFYLKMEVDLNCNCKLKIAVNERLRPRFGDHVGSVTPLFMFGASLRWARAILCLSGWKLLQWLVVMVTADRVGNGQKGSCFLYFSNPRLP